MARTTKRTKRGRPRLPANEKKLPSLGFRASLETRKKLEAAVARSGRTLSQEVEFRLEQSFLQDDAKFDDFGGKDKYTLCRLFADGASLLESRLREMMLTRAQASGQLSPEDRKESATVVGKWTWANNWTFFQFAVALWMWTVKGIISPPAPPGIKAFEKAFHGGVQPDAGLGQLDALGEKLASLIARTGDVDNPSR